MVPPVNIGDVVAEKYLIERVLGKGGMGVVYVAKHLQLGERVAIKFLQRKTLENAELVARFLREGRTAASLRSEHIARVRDVGTMPDGAPYLVMEYLDGRDFDAVLTEHGALDPQVAVKYVLQACEALAEAHSIGIIHRDLKPANLILIRKRDGTTAIKIIDFGISKLMASEGGPEMTQAAVMMGSPLYMAPEQMASARDADARSDVFSLGAIFYHLLTGKPPFLGSSAVDVFERITQGPPSPRELRPELPAGIEAITARCLCKKREQRYPDVAALAAALAPFGPPHAQLYAESAERILRAAANTAAESSPVAPSGVLAPSPVRANKPPPPKPPPPPHAGTTAKKGPPPRPKAPPPPEEPEPAARPRELLDELFEMEMEKERPRPAASEPPARPISMPPREGPPESAPPPPGSPLAPAGKAMADAVISAVQEALSGFGLAGTVALEGRFLTLHGNGPPTSIDAGPAVEQWPLLPPEMQRRKALDLARRMAEAHRVAQRGSPSRPGSAGGESLVPWATLGKAIGATAVVALVAMGARAYLRSRDEVPLPPPVAAETPAEQSRRLETSCRAVRERVYSGATIGPYDTSGWVVDLWLASRPGPLPGADAGTPSSRPVTRDSMADTVDSGRLAPRLDDALGKLTDGTLAFADDSIPATSSAWTGVTLRFGGAYSRAFFEPEPRTRFLALADRLFESSGADLGALYAHCAGGAVHDVGAWFRGRDPGAAATALLWGVGMFAERPQIDRAALGSAEIDSLRAATATAKLDAPLLKGLVAVQGGSLTAAPGAVTLAFPLGGPIRAASASRAVAARIGIGRE
jgi:eukaryotic-like serine/threonine-protein kinase